MKRFHAVLVSAVAAAALCTASSVSAKPPPTSSVTIDEENCIFTGTFSWSDFKLNALTAAGVMVTGYIQLIQLDIGPGGNGSVVQEGQDVGWLVTDGTSSRAYSFNLSAHAVNGPHPFMVQAYMLTFPPILANKLPPAAFAVLQPPDPVCEGTPVQVGGGS